MHAIDDGYDLSEQAIEADMPVDVVAEESESDAIVFEAEEVVAGAIRVQEEAEATRPAEEPQVSDDADVQDLAAARDESLEADDESSQGDKSRKSTPASKRRMVGAADARRTGKR